MAILLLDVGNSRIKWASLDGAVLVDWGMHDRPHESAIAAFADAHWGGMAKPSDVLAASVTSRAFSEALGAELMRRWQVQVDYVVPQAAAYGVANGYTDPLQLGVDRWVSLVWARHTVADAATCIIDCGTAITLDLLTADGTHHGGLIAPGLWLMERSLYLGTGGLQSGVEQPLARVPPVGPLARDTLSGIKCGAYYAATGLIERAVAELVERIDGPLHRVITGGDADILRPALGPTFRHEPDLVLKGLAITAGVRG